MWHEMIWKWVGLDLRVNLNKKNLIFPLTKHIKNESYNPNFETWTYLTLLNNASFLGDNSGSTWDGVPQWYTKEPIVPVPSIFLEIKALKFMKTSPSSYDLLLRLKLDDYYWKTNFIPTEKMLSQLWAYSHTPTYPNSCNLHF